MTEHSRIRKFERLLSGVEMQKLTDKEIEDYIWENISISLSQIDKDTQSDGYIQYLNAVHWAKWGRDNSKFGL